MPTMICGSTAGITTWREQRVARHAEVLRRAQVAPLDRVHAGGRLHDHREHRRDEDQVDRRGVADAEPEDRDRDPGDRRDRPQDLEDRIERRRTRRAPSPSTGRAARRRRPPARSRRRRASATRRCARQSVPSSDQLERAGDDLPGRREDDAAACARRPPTRRRSAARSPPPTAGVCLNPAHVDRRCPQPIASPAPDPPAQPRPRRGGKRIDDDRHLSARVRRAGELIARTPARTAAGSSGPASSASGRRSAARRPGSCSTSTSLHAERQADLVGQDLDRDRPPCAAPRCPSGSRRARRATADADGASAAHAERRRARPRASSSDHAGARVHSSAGLGAHARQQDWTSCT